LTALTVADCGERALIARITQRLPVPAWVLVGPGDDAAVLEPVRGALEVLTTDVQVDGVHVDRRFVPPEAVGHRALAVNLSDLAAMGARPRAALLSLALPPSLGLEELDRILDGLLGLAASSGTAIVGGNITSTEGPLAIDVTVTGSVHRRRILRRSGARPGDEVFVTGTLGDAAAGLHRLRSAFERGEDLLAARTCAARYLHPEPRLRAGVQLGAHRAASSCMDLSDGLADGIRQLAQASDLGMTLDAAAVPVSAETREWLAQHGFDPLQVALAGGDDFELIFTVRPAHAGRLRGVRRLVGNLPITRIGVMTRSRALIMRDGRNERELPAGYEHFKS
jgi:thiamine-monophosphate kinase